MPEVVKGPTAIIIALAVFVVLIVLVFELFSVKIGSLMCNFIGKLIISAFGYSGVFLGLTNTGIEAVCNAFPI